MKQRLILLSTVLLMVGTHSHDVAGQSPFLWGYVKWATGYPAMGMEVRLVRNGAVKSSVYSDQAGSYAFFGIDGRPSEFSVMVYSRESILGQIRVPDIPAGRQLPDITLTGQVLRAKVAAVPSTVTAGQKTVITVTVQDGSGRPISDVNVTVSAGGGKFLSPVESYDPRSRLQGPYRTTGLTNASGSYTTAWACNPCAAAYVLRVEGTKNYYILSASDLRIEVRP